MLLVFPRLEAGPDFARLDVWPGRAELCPGLLPRCDGNLVPSALVVGMMCMRASEIFGRLAELVRCSSFRQCSRLHVPKMNG